MFYTHGCIFYDPNLHDSSLEITVRRLIFSKAPFKSVLWVKTHTFWRHEEFQNYLDFFSKLIIFWILLVLLQTFLNIYVVFSIRRSIQNTLERNSDVTRTDYACVRNGAHGRTRSMFMKWVKSREIHFFLNFSDLQRSWQRAPRWAPMFSNW